VRPAEGGGKLVGLTDKELKASMMAEAEAVIEKLLRQQKPAEQITLTEIEGLGIKARQEVGEGLTRILVEHSAAARQVPGPACPECGREMHYKGLKGKRVVSETGEVEVKRAYYYCAGCRVGLFPPG
jgi:tRNA(Ile2) C34 agmatinyltransferase TiaS